MTHAYNMAPPRYSARQWSPHSMHCKQLTIHGNHGGTVTGTVTERLWQIAPSCMAYYGTQSLTSKNTTQRLITVTFTVCSCGCVWWSRSGAVTPVAQSVTLF